MLGVRVQGLKFRVRLPPGEGDDANRGSRHARTKGEAAVFAPRPRHRRRDCAGPTTRSSQEQTIRVLWL